MGKKSPSVPKPPDPVKTAEAQAQANKEALDESARINAVNLYGPNGAVTYAKGPDGVPTDQYTQLTPQGQWLYDAQQAIAGQLSQQAYGRVANIPTDPYSLQGMPYDPRGYNTSGYSTFSPISYPRDMGQADTSFPQPNTTGYDSFFQPPQGGQGANVYNQVAAALGGKGGPQQPPQAGNSGIVPAAAGGSPVPGSSAPAGGTATGQSPWYQQSPGTSGGQTVPIDNKWFPDSSVYTTPGGPPGQQTSQPQMPGTPGYPTTPAVTPKPPAAPAAAPWKYGDALTADIMTRKPAANAPAPTGVAKAIPASNTVTGYGLSLAQTLNDKYKGNLQQMLGDHSNAWMNPYNVKSAQDLLYLNKPQQLTWGVNLSGGQAQPAVDYNQVLNNYRFDHPNTPAPAAAPAPTPAPAAAPPRSVMPTMPGASGASPQPYSYAGQSVPQSSTSPQPFTGANGLRPGQMPLNPNGGNSGGAHPQSQMPPQISQALQSLGGKGGGGQPPAPTQVSGGNVSPSPQTNGQPGQPGANGSIPASYPTSNLNALPYDPRSYGDINMYDNKVQNAVFDQQMKNLKPVIDQNFDRQYQSLQDRGIPVGSDAWNKAVDTLNRDAGNQYQQAANQAIAAGGQEAQRQMSMEQGLRGTAWSEALGAHQQDNSDIQQRLQIEQNLRNQAIQDYNMQRTGAFNEASAFLQGSPALQMQQTPNMPTYNMQAPDIIGATMSAYQGQMQAYNAQVASAGSAWQGAAGIVGGLASKCSRTYKHDDAPATRVLDALKQIPVRTWRYKPNLDPRQELHIGPYAEDWKNFLGLGTGMEINHMDAIGVLMKSVQELSDELTEMKIASAKKAKPKKAAAKKVKAKKGKKK